MRRTFPRSIAVPMFTVALMLAMVIPAGGATTLDWVEQFGTRKGDFAYGVSVDGAGNSYVSGQTFGKLPGQKAHGDSDAFVRALDPSGAVLWTRQFGTRRFDVANQTAVDATGVYVTGETEGRLGVSRLGRRDVYVRKYGLAGNLLWTRQFGTRQFDLAFNVVVDATQMYVIGSTNGRLPGATRIGDQDMYLAAFDLDGNPAWTQQYGTRRYDLGYANVVDGTGVYAIGFTGGRLPGQDRAGDLDITVHRFALDGSPVWGRQMGSRRDDFGYGIAVAPTGLFVGGSTNGRLPGQERAGDSDAWIGRLTKATGRTMWTRQFGGRRFDELSSIAIDGTSVRAGGDTASVLDGQRPAGDLDAFSRGFAFDGTVQNTFLFGTRRSDICVWAAGGGGSLVMVGFTSGKFPGQTKVGEYDAFAAHLTFS